MKNPFKFPSSPSPSLANAIGPSMAGSIGPATNVAGSNRMSDAEMNALATYYDSAVRSPLGQNFGTQNVQNMILTNDGRARMIAMRLRLPSGKSFPFDQFTTLCTPDKVFVAMIIKNDMVTLEDDYAMFPSDALITRLRLLME